MSDNLNTIGIRGKIAARTPDYRYTLPEGGNPGDIPVKTETGVEWQQPEPATTTPDYLQNDETASDYIKNRPGGYTVTQPAINIEWDGVIGDRVSVDYERMKYVKVSDEIFDKKSIAAGRLTVLIEGEQRIEDDLGHRIDDGYGYIMIYQRLTVVNRPGISIDDIVFPEAGIYLAYFNENTHAVSFTLPAKSVIVPIPNKYIRQCILADDSPLDLTTDANMEVNLVIATEASVKLEMNSYTSVYVIAGNGICTVTNSSGLVVGFIPDGMMGKVVKAKSLVSVVDRDYGIYKQIQVTKGNALPYGISAGEGGVPVRTANTGNGNFQYAIANAGNDGGFVGIAILESRGTALLQTSGCMNVRIRTDPLTTFTDVLEPVTKADEGKLVRLCAYGVDSAGPLRIVKYKAENNNSRLAKIISVNETSGTAAIWLY